jgi:hypothetical protein
VTAAITSVAEQLVVTGAAGVAEDEGEGATHVDAAVRLHSSCGDLVDDSARWPMGERRG